MKLKARAFHAGNGQYRWIISGQKGRTIIQAITSSLDRYKTMSAARAAMIRFAADHNFEIEEEDE